MPEILSKHPKVVQKVLESAGAKCGKGAPQKILTQCPRENFCLLPGGEICVFGSGQIESMTQLKKEEVCASPPAARSSMASPEGVIALLIFFGAAFATRLRRRGRP